jgi:hypothetical protein
VTSPGLTCLVVVYVALYWFAFSETPRRTGDGFEYALMLESLYNHASPDLQVVDIQTLQRTLSRFPAHNFGPMIPDDLTSFCEPKSRAGQQLGNMWGYYRDRSGRNYSRHFWFYPLLCVPAKCLLRALDRNETAAFQITNVTLALMTALIALWLLPHSLAIYATLLFMCSGTLYYLGWSHPEVMSASFLWSGLLTFHSGRLLLAFFFLALGSLQNPTIALAIPVLWLVRRDHFLPGRSEWLPLLGSAGIVVLPPAFFWTHFGFPSLIGKYAYRAEFVTWRRFHSFFLDWNIGAIVGIPFILCAAIMMFVYLLVFKRDALRDPLLMLPLVAMFPVVVGTLGTDNWNSGQAVFCRYVYWGCLPLSYFVLMASNWARVVPWLLLSVCVSLQAVCNLIAGGWNAPEEYVKMKRVPTWILNQHPGLYNPDPEIFYERIRHGDGWLESGETVAWRTPDGVLRKVLWRMDRGEAGARPFDPTLLERGHPTRVLVDRGCIYFNFDHIVRPPGSPTTAEWIAQSERRYREGKYDAAIQAAEEALRLDPLSAVAYNNIGASYGALGRWGDEIIACLKALQIEPELTLAKNNLAYARAQLQVR